jgi:hypothetical protein
MLVDRNQHVLDGGPSGGRRTLLQILINHCPIYSRDDPLGESPCLYLIIAADGPFISTELPVGCRV